MHYFLRVFLSASVLLAGLLPTISVLLFPVKAQADATAPYSKPFHKQGRGWYPSIYWSTGRNLGSFYFPNTDGSLFREPTDLEWDKEKYGIIYFYRPESQWASEELEAPSYYINDMNVFNLRGGSYTYVVLPTGTYDIAVRKSLLPLIGLESHDNKLFIAFDLNLQADFGLQVSPGQEFWVRHSEVVLPKKRHPDLTPEDEMATADVQLVDREQAMSEIIYTRYLTESFWHPADASRAEELLKGEMKPYGWFEVIFPWSDNFLWGIPIFYVPSDLVRELMGERPLTVEQQLYQLKDDPEAYLEALRAMREPKRNFNRPWQPPSSGLTLNDELTLERLEKDALAGNIKPVKMPEAPPPKEKPEHPWYWPFGREFVAEPRPSMYLGYKPVMDDQRKARVEALKESLE